ncbi:MAG: hypothetical protein EOO52_12890 [Gammaproteobacteria bacterium]|nr:MAG: hypothetical protein EOO52_12890 [Gammaproteobacteria bacterium]
MQIQNRRITDNAFSADDFSGFFETLKTFKRSVAYTAEQQLIRLENVRRALEIQLKNVLDSRAKSLFGIAHRYFKIRELEREISEVFDRMVSWMRSTCRHFSKTRINISDR